jgi:hypothetical protein
LNLNYFSYFSEIEDTFIRRRGKHLMLSSIDWALIESWKERGVPLHVALRAIEHAFDSHEAKKRKRSVKTLLYCQEEVEAQYAEWLESRVGSHDDADESGAGEDAGKPSPFSRAAVLEYLDHSLAELASLSHKRLSQDELFEALSRATDLLAEIKDDFAATARSDTRKLEDSLTGIERLLDDAMLKTITANELNSIREEIDAQLKPYRRQMDKSMLKQTADNLVRKRLRELFSVPRLSLFYL